MEVCTKALTIHQRHCTTPGKTCTCFNPVLPLQVPALSGSNFMTIDKPGSELFDGSDFLLLRTQYWWFPRLYNLACSQTSPEITSSLLTSTTFTMDPSANRLDLTKVLYYITRSPGVHVPLVPVDELPDFLDIEGIPRRADPEQLKCLIPLDPLPRHPHSKLCVTIGGQRLRAPSSVVLPSQKVYSAPDAEIKAKRFSAESGPSKLPDHADRMDAIIGKHAATQPRDPEEECRVIIPPRTFEAYR